MTTVAEPTITPEMVEAMRSQLGVECVPRDRAWHESVTPDNIYHFARGVGDPNPLWNDEDYSGNRRWGGMIAPPTFLLSCGLHVQRGFPGIFSLWTSDDWDYRLPLRLGDKVACTFTLVDLSEMQGGFAGLAYRQVEEFVFRNQRGEIVGTNRRTFVRMEKQAAREKGKYKAISRHVYSSTELEAIADAYRAEQRRGAAPRFWEDVVEGEELPPIVKGPLTVSSEVAWLGAIGGGQFTYVHKMAFDFWDRHPKARILHPGTNVPEFSIAVHWDERVAQDRGIPIPYDIGGERIAWLGHLLSDWMGDDGFVRRHYVELRRVNVMGDTTWCRGEVTRKWVENGEHLVECATRAENQRGEVTTRARSVVQLPSRETGAWPADQLGSGSGVARQDGQRQQT